MDYEKYKNMALSALAGAGDEASFGLEEKYWPSAKKIMEENPHSATAGRIGSYFIPFGGEAELGVKGLRKLLANNALQHGAERLATKILPKAATEGLTKAGARGGLSALLAGSGNLGARKVLGTDNLSSDENKSNLALQTGMGVAGGSLGHALQDLAPAIYNHPAIMNADEATKSKALAKELMDEGQWGRFSSFEDKANELKSPFQDLMKSVRGKLKGAESNELESSRQLMRRLGHAPEELPQKGLVNTDNLKNDLETATLKRKRGAPQPEEVDSLENSFNMGREGLQPKGPWNTTNLDEVDKALHQTNTDLSKLRKNQRAAAMSADPGTGAVSDPVENKLDWKRALEGIEERALDRYGSSADKAAVGATKPDYGKGRDLTRNLLDFERTHMRSSPHIGHSWVDSLANSTVKSLPVRTGLGVLTNKSAPEVMGSKIGSILRSYQNGKQDEPMKGLSPNEAASHFIEKSPEFQGQEEAAPSPDSGNSFDEVYSEKKQGKAALPATGRAKTKNNSFDDIYSE